MVQFRNQEVLHLIVGQVQSNFFFFAKNFQVNQERIKLLKAYIQEEPGNPFNRYALAMEYYEEKPDEALTLLKDMATDHPEYLPTYFKLAHLYWELEDWDNAETTFTNGIALAEHQNDQKALSELKSAFQNFEFERE